MLLNCGVGEDSWESLGLQGDPTSPFWRRLALGFLWKEWLKLKLQSFGHLMRRVDSVEKTLMLGGIEGRRKRTTEDEMVGWHHQLNGHGFGCTLGVGDEQGGLVCYTSWGHKESDATERLNWTEWKMWDMLRHLTKGSLRTCWAVCRVDNPRRRRQLDPQTQSFVLQ